MTFGWSHNKNANSFFFYGKAPNFARARRSIHPKAGNGGGRPEADTIMTWKQRIQSTMVNLQHHPRHCSAFSTTMGEGVGAVESLTGIASRTSVVEIQCGNGIASWIFSFRLYLLCCSLLVVGSIAQGFTVSTGYVLTQYMKGRTAVAHIRSTSKSSIKSTHADSHFSRIDLSDNASISVVPTKDPAFVSSTSVGGTRILLATIAASAVASAAAFSPFAVASATAVTLILFGLSKPNQSRSNPYSLVLLLPFWPRITREALS